MDYIALVPLTGLEPVRGCPQGILSPWCLPIPPQRRMYVIVMSLRLMVPLPCCGARHLRRLSKAFLICRPLPQRLAKCRPLGGCSLAWRLRAHIARVACSATGSAPLAPRTRTGTRLPSRDFKSLVSTYSTTTACCMGNHSTFYENRQGKTGDRGAVIIFFLHLPDKYIIMSQTPQKIIFGGSYEAYRLHQLG